jgi:hypothetical protein
MRCAPLFRELFPEEEQRMQAHARTTSKFAPGVAVLRQEQLDSTRPERRCIRNQSLSTDPSSLPVNVYDICKQLHLTVRCAISFAASTSRW